MLFYATPIIYYPEQLQESNLGWLLKVNPMVSLLELVRQPILKGEVPTLGTFTVAITTVVIAFLAASWTLARLQRRLIFHL
jgi:lipopolysaccharide transport system permease protein